MNIIKDLEHRKSTETQREQRVCEVCGNQYDKCFEVRMDGGDVHIFDSFECAIHALAPICAHCGCRILGHGLKADDVFYCCTHCANQHGGHGMEERHDVYRNKV